MQEEIETVQNSKLNDKWTFYYHLPDDKKWDLSSYKHVNPMPFEMIQCIQPSMVRIAGLQFQKYLRFGCPTPI